MGRTDDRNEYGQKNKIFIKINGKSIGRAFRNEGEARRYLTAEGYTKDDIRRGIVKIVRN
jgi:hypothetical protein